MKRFGLYIIILYSVLFLAGCHDDLEIPVQPVQPRGEAERTVIVYMVADHTPPLPAQQDTTEMVKGKDLIPEDVNFIIFLDNKGERPAIYELSAKGGMQLWKQYDQEVSSTDANVMLDALRQIEQYFPARHYGITFWSHATGWTPEHNSSRRKTFGKDEDSGTTSTGKIEMEIPQMREALTQLPKFDYIFFDACFMQCIEVAYELRHVTNYMIGSPAEIPGPGAPYHKIIKALCTSDVNGIIDGYQSGYPQSPYPGVLLSCIDCTKLEALAQITGKLLTPFFMEHKQPLTTDFQSYCDRSWQKYTFCYDMCTTMYCLLSEEDYAEWKEYFGQAVTKQSIPKTNQWYAAHCTRLLPTVTKPFCYGGVSMFVPLSNYESYGWNADFQNTSWYAATGWSLTGW